MSRKLTKEDVRHLGKLSNLSLSDSEVEKYENQLDETLEFVNNLTELQTDKIDPSHSVIELENAMFEDGENNERLLSQEDALGNGKKRENGQFEVDKIL